jgi:hypothetical protein
VWKSEDAQATMESIRKVLDAARTGQPLTVEPVIPGPAFGRTRPRLRLSHGSDDNPKVTSWRRRLPLRPRQVVRVAAARDLYQCGYTAHPTESGLERDNTPADRKSRRVAPPCRA